MAGESRLMRAGSWQPQGDPMLLKTTSDLLLHVQALQQCKVAHRLSEDAGKTNSVDSSSTAAGQSAAAHTLLHDSATASLLPPLRQISLDIIAASELNRAKGLSASLERNSIFNDVFNELAGRDELAPLQAGQLYTLPSMQFLESMLNDLDTTKSGSNQPGAAGGGGSGGMGGPLDLPGDAFDLPSDYPAAMAHAPGQQQQQQQHLMAMQAAEQQQHAAMAMAADLRPTPFDQQQQLLHQQQQQYGGAMSGAHLGMVPAGGGGYGGFVPTSSATAHLAAMHLGGSSGSSCGSMTLQASMRAHIANAASSQHQHVMLANSQQMHAQHGQHGQHALPVDYTQMDDAATRMHIAMLQQQQAAAMAAQASAAAAADSVAARPPPGVVGAGVRQPAVPHQAVQQRATPRRASQAYADFEYEEAEVSLQTSKSGRVRKVASFTGVKRKLDIAHASESRDSRGSVGPDASAGEVGSKGSKASRKPSAGGAKCRKGRRTVCLNCGCHQTPQWRCGPLGPRTLCNACGVRYKKDLPLNCWPIRDGMVLPPGALLPPGFVVPPGITIHTQPAELE